MAYHVVSRNLIFNLILVLNTWPGIHVIIKAQTMKPGIHVIIKAQTMKPGIHVIIKAQTLGQVSM